MFAKLLVANRGEIACRVMATARRLGIATVAVYSDADAGARHVALADEAWPIGPAPARQSYLRIDRILEAARRSGAEAIHPGYGFLSENADFAEACAAAGIAFVGPPATAIRAMGSKAAAKALMERSGVPLVPGYHGEAQDDGVLTREAARIGFPVLVKASAGGGGKGMRVVDSADGLGAALDGARSEARASFGDDRLLLERYLQRPRHIEVQVFADTHGNTVSLFERDCSIQRRHQKVVEEAPAPGMDPARRQAMGAAAVAAARAVGYVGAGTVEFIVEAGGADGDKDGGVGSDAFYFMEMNTRLQVEHPVTEAITGQDLVEWQLRVACGEALPLGGAGLGIAGHAIEVRVYAEDPARDYLPSIGRLTHLRQPAERPGVRVDTGVRQGDAITPHYDPMIAKLIVHGPDRDAAVRLLGTALAEYEVVGVQTNLGLLRAIAGHPGFAAGGMDTGFLGRHPELLAPAGSAVPDGGVMLAAACLAALADGRAAREAAQAAAGMADGGTGSPWGLPDAWRMNGAGWQDVVLRGPDGAVTVRAWPLDAGGAGTRFRLDLPEATPEGGPGGGVVAEASETADGMILRLDGVQRRLRVVRDGEGLVVLSGGRAQAFSVLDPLAPPRAEAGGEDRVIAPIPARVARVLVAVGDAVARGAPLLVLEAMKMELTLRAPAEGVVASLRHGVDEMVEEGVELVTFEPRAVGPQAIAVPGEPTAPAGRRA